MARAAALLVLLGLAAVAPRAGAEEADRGALRLLLMAHHEPDAAAALSGLAGDPRETLAEVATDRAEPALARRRAATLLGRLGGARVEATLAALVAATDEGSVRRAAARALARAMADRPEALLPLLEPLLRSPEPDDRETAVWLLADLDTEGARRRLSRLRVVERHLQVVDALRRAARGR